MATCLSHIESSCAIVLNNMLPQMHLRPCLLDASTIEKRNEWYKQGVKANEAPTDNIFHVGRCSSDGNLTRE